MCAFIRRNTELGKSFDNNGVYKFLDLLPKGRNEAELPWTMAWLRRHDRYSLSRAIIDVSRVVPHE